MSPTRFDNFCQVFTETTFIGCWAPHLWHTRTAFACCAGLSVWSPPVTCARLCSPGDHHWPTAGSLQVLLRLMWLYSKHHLSVDFCWYSIWKQNIIWVRKGVGQVKQDNVQMTKSGNIQPIYSDAEMEDRIQSHQYILRNAKQYRKQMTLL